MEIKYGPAALVGLVAILIAAASFKVVSTFFIFIVLFLVGVAGACYALGERTVHFLDQDEQLVVEGFTETIVKNGPGVKVLNPLGYRSTRRRKAVTLAASEYCKVQNTLDGSVHLEKGPKLFFLAPYEEAEETATAKSLGSTDYLLVVDSLTGSRSIVKGPCMWLPAPYDAATQGRAVSLSSTEYIIVEDKLSGAKKTIRGPCVWFPGSYEVADQKQSAVALQEDEYIRIKDLSTGNRWVQKGKALVFPEPTWQIEGSGLRGGGVRKAWSLKAYEYVRLLDSLTGKVSTYHGEKTVFPGPDESLLDGEVLSAIDLKVHEYVKILNQATGVIRVESGVASASQQVFLGPNDKCLDGGKKKAIEVDEEHAVLVRDKGTGQLRLVTERQLFVPAPNESIEEVRQLIRLADHEALIVKHNDGAFQYYYGSEKKRATGQPRSFFLPPYSEIVKLNWSRGRRREKRDLWIDRFDCRPQFMSFEFNCRTSDNVELVLEGTFFWEVVDLPNMVKNTGDTSGDICAHARSQFIRHVARVTLKEFMDSSHIIAKKVWEEDASFYESRGVNIQSLEVTRYQCADARTSAILEQIIQETTNRMNRLSQAESENEIGLFRTQGQIEQEKMNGDLLKIQHDHSKEEAEVTGKAEAARIAAFMSGLEDTIPKLEDRAHMWQVLRKTEALDVVSKSGANLYFTPKDVDLSIESKKM